MHIEIDTRNYLLNNNTLISFEYNFPILFVYLHGNVCVCVRFSLCWLTALIAGKYCHFKILELRAAWFSSDLSKKPLAAPQPAANRGKIVVFGFKVWTHYCFADFNVSRKVQNACISNGSLLRSRDSHSEMLFSVFDVVKWQSLNSGFGFCFWWLQYVCIASIYIWYRLFFCSKMRIWSKCAEKNRMRLFSDCQKRPSINFSHFDSEVCVCECECMLSFCYFFSVLHTINAFSLVFDVSVARRMFMCARILFNHPIVWSCHIFIYFTHRAFFLGVFCRNTSTQTCTHDSAASTRLEMESLTFKRFVTVITI